MAILLIIILLRVLSILFFFFKSSLHSQNISAIVISLSVVHTDVSLDSLNPHCFNCVYNRFVVDAIPLFACIVMCVWGERHLKCLLAIVLQRAASPILFIQLSLLCATINKSYYIFFSLIGLNHTNSIESEWFVWFECTRDRISMWRYVMKSIYISNTQLDWLRRRCLNDQAITTVSTKKPSNINRNWIVLQQQRARAHTLAHREWKRTQKTKNHFR